MVESNQDNAFNSGFIKGIFDNIDAAADSHALRMDFNNTKASLLSLLEPFRIFLACVPKNIWRSLS